MRKILLLLSILLIVGASGAVFAQEEEEDDLGSAGHLPVFDDGRLNAYDLDAPVAVYDHTTTFMPSSGSTPCFVAGIEVWAYDPRTNTSQKVLCATSAELTESLRSTEDVAIMTNGLYSLNYSTDGYFWVTAPASQGRTYSFSWEA